MLPTPADILAAAYRLRGVINRTPLVYSKSLSAVVGADVWLKCENLQHTGSFKLRGAYNALASLSPDARQRGIVASSAGNHGLGVAYSAQLLGMRARIFVPASAPTVKRDGIIALGADVDATQPHYDEAHDAAVAYGNAHGMTYVNPCAGATLLAGQGTVGLEILEELPDARMVVIPIGGAGLLGGVATIVRANAPSARIAGAQGDRSNAMAASIAAGHRVEVAVTPTLADGLSGQIDEDGFVIGKSLLDEIHVVSEKDIANAIAWLAREHDMKVEGSGAVGVAALLTRKLSAPRGPVAVIVSGGNIDDAVWRDTIAAGVNS
ncbi:MAG: threonine/serine dehydratase [bacterium]